MVRFFSESVVLSMLNAQKRIEFMMVSLSEPLFKDLYLIYPFFFKMAVSCPVNTLPFLLITPSKWKPMTYMVITKNSFLLRRSGRWSQ